MTTSSVCAFDPTLDPDDPDCIPDVAVDGVCFELASDGTVARFWFEVRNRETSDLAVAWSDGTRTVPAGGSTVVATESPAIVLTVGGRPVADATRPTDFCQQAVLLANLVDGPAPEGATYRIQLSRLVGTSSVPEGDPIELAAGASVELAVPSTFDPAGINYRIEAIDPAVADATSITPDSIVLEGHRSRTITVIVQNSFAAISIDATADADAVAPGGVLVYRLTTRNTGALPLDPVVVVDRLPPEVVLADGGASVTTGRGSCALVEATRPQLVRCVLDGVLAPGDTAPAVELTVVVDAGLTATDPILNQALAIGIDDPDLAPDPLPGTSSTGLVCEPAPGTVCDLSARIATRVEIAPVPSTTIAEAAPVPTTIPPDDATTATTAPGSSNGSDDRSGLAFLGSTSRSLIMVGTVLLLVGVGMLLNAQMRPTDL